MRILSENLIRKARTATSTENGRRTARRLESSRSRGQHCTCFLTGGGVDASITINLVCFISSVARAKKTTGGISKGNWNAKRIRKRSHGHNSWPA